MDINLILGIAFGVLLTCFFGTGVFKQRTLRYLMKRNFLYNLEPTIPIKIKFFYFDLALDDRLGVERMKFVTSKEFERFCSDLWQYLQPRDFEMFRDKFYRRILKGQSNNEYILKFYFNSSFYRVTDGKQYFADVVLPDIISVNNEEVMRILLPKLMDVFFDSPTVRDSTHLLLTGFIRFHYGEPLPMKIRTTYISSLDERLTKLSKGEMLIDDFQSKFWEDMDSISKQATLEFT